MPILETILSPLVRNHQARNAMKCKYCLIRNEGELMPSSFVYVIWVGSSLRESECLALVECYCNDIGWYFKKWSLDVDSELMKRTKTIRLDGTKLVTPYQMISLTINQCFDAILDDAWESIEASRVMSPQEKFLRFRHDPKFLMAYNQSKRNTPRQPSRSKYLSRRRSRAFYDLVPSLLFAIALFILDAIVSNIFGWL